MDKGSELAKESQMESANLDMAENNVTKFLDAYIDKNPEKMRKEMSDNFQANFDFDKLSQDNMPKTPVSFRILRVSKEAGSYAVVAEILYEFVKNGKQKTSQHNYSLVEDTKSSRLLINSDKVKKSSQPFYKKPLFWVLSILALVVLSSLAYWLVQNKKMTQNQKSISASWQEITTEAGAVNVLGDKAAQDKSAFNDYSKELHTFANMLSGKKFSADQITAQSNDKTDVNNYRSAVGAMNDYIQYAASQSDNINDYTSSDDSKLNDLSGTAQNVVNNFQNQAKFLQAQLPQKIFSVSNVFTKVKDQINSVNEKEQAAKDAAAAAVAQDAADKTTVTNNVTTFEQGFIAGNAATMRPVMTSGFQGEYNFNQLNPDQRQYTYPSSFRIISVVKQTDGSYKVQVNILYKNVNDSNQYTQGYTYSVISQNSKWLINNESVGNSF